MEITCKYNDPFNVPSGVPDDFDFGLVVGNKYLVMAMVVYKGSNDLYYLTDVEGRPNWFPHQLFEISDSKIPKEWYFNSFNDLNSDLLYIIGFEEISSNPRFYDQLVNRDEGAMRTYFKRKTEIKENLDVS